jgi:membrane fusion protein
MEARTQGARGAIQLATPLSLRMWALLGVAFGVSLLAWLGWGHYTRRERVSGSLTPQAGLITVSARGLGVLTKVTAHEGDSVHAGDVLVTFSSERSSAALGDTGADISTQLHQQQNRLQTDLANAQQLAEVQAKDLRRQAVALEGELSQIDAQMLVARRQVTELSALLQRFESLGHKGYTSAVEVQQQRTQEADAEQQVQTLARQRGELQQQRESARRQLDELPLTTATKLNELQRQLAQVHQSLAQNEADRVTVLRAPADGVVSAVMVKPGQAVTPGQALVSLVPQGSRLLAQLWVASGAVGFVHPGTPVVLRFPAFPYQKFGVQQGTVITVSRSALTPAEVSAELGQAPTQEALYRVEVALPAQQVDVYGTLQSLKPGMTVEADLLLDRRRMVEWIFEPLYGLSHRHASEAHG